MVDVKVFQDRLDKYIAECGYTHYSLAQKMQVDQKTIDGIFKRNSFPVMK